MKQILFLFLIGLLTNLIYAQDIIIKRNGDEIKSKILEITSETIKYKEFDFQDGPIRNINISDVFMVIYENGKREKFTGIEGNTQRNKTPANKKNKIQANKKNKITKNKITIKKKAFIGLELGANIFTYKSSSADNSTVKPGFQIHFINFGYLFSKNIGITFTWFDASYLIFTDFPVSPHYEGILIGPLFSFPISENIEWDIKSMIGPSLMTILSGTYGGAPIEFNVGTGFRFNISRLIALTLSVDYTTAKFNLDCWSNTGRCWSQIGMIAINGGFAFRL